MKILFAFLIAVVVTVAFYFALQPYLHYEGAYKDSMESLNVKLPRSMEIRFEIYHWIGCYWYLLAMGIFSATFAALATMGLTSRTDATRNAPGEPPA